jgi:hypothetical protein
MKEIRLKPSAELLEQLLLARQCLARSKVSTALKRTDQLDSLITQIMTVRSPHADAPG